MADWSFHARGFSLFPLHANSKRPALDSWEIYQSQRAPEPLVATWAAGPWNTGVATGLVSGVIVLDCDNLLARIEAESRGVPPTLTVSTPRGTHFYFQHPGWPVSNHAGRSWTRDLDGGPVDGWDLRADGGYVVGPGSRYVPTADEAAKGKVAGAYTVELDVAPAVAPDWLLALIFPKPRQAPIAPRTCDETTTYGRRALEAEIAVLMAAQPGSINSQVNLSAFALGQLVAGGEIVADEALGALEEALAVLGIDGEDKAQGTMRRGWESGLENPRGVAHSEPVTPEQALGTRTTPTALVAPPPPPGDTPLPVVEYQHVTFLPPVKPNIVGGNNMAQYFAGCVYVARRDQMFIPSGILLDRPAFDVIYGGPGFQMEMDGSGKPDKSAWRMFTLNGHMEMPKSWDLVFRPELPSGTIVEIEGKPYLNTYVPIRTPRMAGDASPFVNHVRKMLPNGRDADLLLHWMASCVQNPGAKFQWWPVVQGVKGNGKSLLLEVMFAAVGETYSHHVNADSVIKTGNQFNAWIERKLFLGFEEIRSSEGKRDFVELMKATVTNRRLSTEGKNAGQSTSDNRANGLMLTNHPDACPIDDDERRFGIFFTAQQRFEDLARDGMTGNYFPDLYDWIRGDGAAIVTHYLATFPLQAALDPARGLQRAPETTSTSAAKAESLGLVEQEVLEAIESGYPGFKGGIVSSLALRSMFDRLRRTIAPKRYKGIMASVGYQTHPALEGNKGRPNTPLSDGSRPVLYFRNDHELLKFSGWAEIADAAEKLLLGVTGETSNVVPFQRPR